MGVGGKGGRHEERRGNLNHRGARRFAEAVELNEPRDHRSGGARTDGRKRKERTEETEAGTGMEW